MCDHSDPGEADDPALTTTRAQSMVDGSQDRTTTESGTSISDMPSEMNSVLSASHPSFNRLPTVDPSLKRRKIDALSNASLKDAGSATNLQSSSRSLENLLIAASTEASAVGGTVDTTCDADDFTGTVSPENPNPAIVDKEVTAASALSVPLKATKFSHLRQKYLHELEYMLTEFQKLERQLLGAKAATRESAGSRERREKLHSFIVHLDETVQQIQSGCRLEAEGKSTAPDDSPVDAGLSNLTTEKKEEENIQKLEEHILANLLPVKVRLKKQLAAQQGAKHNPAGMPVRGALQAAEKGKATFAVERRQSTSQFGKPLAGGGSKLTQSLHGSTLGSTNHLRSASTGEAKKVLYAGMAIGSAQMESSVGAASAVHQLVIEDPELFEQTKQASPCFGVDDELPLNDNSMFDALGADVDLLNYDAYRRLKRKKRKRDKKNRDRTAEEQDAEPTAVQPTKRKKVTAKISKSKRGPRTVEYMCALCNEVYNSTCDFNPWWALQQHECPKCHKSQIPRIDIGAPANAIDYHPALLAHADDPAGGSGHGSIGSGSANLPPSHMKSDAFATTIMQEGSDGESVASELSDDDFEVMSEECSMQSELSEREAHATMSPSERAELEKFGVEYTGPKLSDVDSARLLLLMSHASTCPCRHKLTKQREVCRSIKWMMLHVRDCPGTTSTFDVCPFPWCRKVKHLLYHLVSCQQPQLCPICTPNEVSSNLAALYGLNEHRSKKYREQLLAHVKSPQSARSKAAVTGSKTGKVYSHPACKFALEEQASMPLQPIKPVAAPSNNESLQTDLSTPTASNIEAASLGKGGEAEIGTQNQNAGQESLVGVSRGGTDTSECRAKNGCSHATVKVEGAVVTSSDHSARCGESSSSLSEVMRSLSSSNVQPDRKKGCNELQSVEG